MKRVAVIDCDQTVVNTAYSWWQWLELHTKAGYAYEDVSLNYNFADVYADVWDKQGKTGHPFDYWRGKCVYDSLSPIQGSVEALQALHDKGWDIIFVSAVKGDHHKSKYGFLKEHFPFMAAFIATKEKGYVKADLVIDDRNKFLNMFDDRETMLIKKITTFDQCEDLNKSLFASFDDWNSFKIYIEKGIFDAF